ncbi:hypothetical protein [Methylobacterium sp. CM6247]
MRLISTVMLGLLLATAVAAQGQLSNGYEAVRSDPVATLAMPFIRSGSGDPIIFSGITTTAKQFALAKPADATSYRFVNPCNVDVRIRKVSSMSESVTLTTGTRFLARSSETLGTSQPTFVSIIATAAPTGECAPELQYGRGG